MWQPSCENRRLGISHDLLEQGCEILREMGNSRRVEQVAVELEVAADALRLDVKLEGEIEAREPDVDRDQRGLQTGQKQRQPCAVLGAKVDLEDRIVGRITRDVEELDDSLERKLLVLVGPKCSRSYAAADLTERRVAAEPRAKRHGVAEESDHRRELGGRPVRDRAADDDVVHSREPVEQRGEGSEQDHVHGAALGTCQLAHTVGQLPWKKQLVAGALVALYRPARTVGRKRKQLGRSAKLVRPVRDELVEHLALQAVLLPGGEVGVLDGKLWQVREASGRHAFVDPGHLAEEHVVGEGIGSDVVQPDEEHSVLLAEPKERRPDHQILGQVERLA